VAAAFWFWGGSEEPAPQSQASLPQQEQEAAEPSQDQLFAPEPTGEARIAVDPTPHEPAPPQSDDVFEEDEAEQAIQITESPNSAYFRNIIDILESRHFMIHYVTTDIIMSGMSQPMTEQVEIHVLYDTYMFADQSSTSPFSGGTYNHFITVVTPRYNLFLQMGSERYSLHEIAEPADLGVASWYQVIFTMPIRFQGYTQSPVGDYEVYAISFGEDSRFTTLYLSQAVSPAENHGLAFIEWNFMGTRTIAEVHSFSTNPDRTLLNVEIPEHFERSN